MFCVHCKKKSVILIHCKCDNQYCIKHQLPEKHNCTFVFEKHVIEKLPPTKKIDNI